MQSKFSRLSFWKLAFIFLLIIVISEAAKNNKGSNQTKNNFKNYGKYGSGKSNENKCTCTQTQQEKKQNAAAMKIKEIRLCDNVKVPKDWEEGKEISISIEGGANVCIKVDGINSSIVNDVKGVLFKDKTSLEVIYTLALNNQALIRTGSSKEKLQFVAPSLTTIRNTDFHSKRTWKFEFLVELQLSDDTEIPCMYDKKCIIIYSYGYSPVIDHLSNTAVIAHQDIEFRIVRQRSLDIKKGNMALRRIRIEGANDEQHSCDYVTQDKINKDSPVSHYGSRQYSCNLDAIDFIKSGKFLYEDYAGKGLIVDYAETFDVDGSKFQVRVLPSIHQVSTHKGFRGGGGKLRILGNSFKAGKTVFYIDGVECPILEEPLMRPNKKEMVAVCEMPEMPQTEARAFYVGNHGWYQSVYLDNNSIDKVMQQPKMIKPNERILLLNAESPYGNLEFKNQKTVSKFQTLFRVPKTAKYRFFMTASREGRLYMNPTKPNEIFNRQGDLQLILNNEKPHGLRNYYDLYDDKTNQFKTSDEFVMTEGDFYQMEMWHFNGEENEHLTLGVEISNDSPMANSRYEIQRIRYTVPAWNPSFYFKLQWENFNTNQRYSIVFDYYTPDSGSSPYTVGDLKIKLGLWQLKAKIAPYIKKQFGEDIQFTLERNLVLNDQEKYLEIIIGFPKGTTGLPLLQPSIYRRGDADVSKCLRTYHRGSGGFQNKKWKLEVYNPVAKANVLIDNLPQDVADWRLEDRITANIPIFHKKMKVERRQVIENGAIVGYEWILSFPGLRKDIVQVNAMNIDIPDAEFKSQTLQDYSDNIFLFPAPYSLFYTIHDKPQVTVKVDKQLGACNWAKNPKEACSIEMEEPNAKITSFECKAPYTELIILGEELHTQNYEYIMWAGQRCEGIKVNKKKITCSIKDPKPGKYKPKVFVNGKGSLKVPNGSDIHIPADMSFTPAQIFSTGGGKLILTLKELPPCTCKVKVFIGSKQCKILPKVRKSKNQLRCKIPKLKEEGDLEVKLEIDGKVTVAPQKIKVKKLNGKAKIENKTRKGTKKGTMSITCGGIQQDLSLKSLKKFFVYLKNKKTGRRVRMRTNRCRYNKQTKENTIDVYYPGCSSGKYSLIVEHEEYGQVNEVEEDIDVGPEIKSVGPLQGSLEGGTILTITGSGFEDQNTVYFNRQECKIESIEGEKIQCKTPPSPKRDSRGNKKNAQASIYMKDSSGDIVKCPDTIDCTYKWKFELTPQIIATSMDNGVFTCMGRGFPADMNEIEVRIGGRKQKMQRVFNKNQFSCKVSDLESAEEEMEVEVKTREGRCRMKNSVRKIRAPKPKFRGISNQKASKRGCRLKVKGEYFAQDSELELINDTGRVICSKMRFLNFNEMECDTQQGQYNPRKCRLRKKNRKAGENGDVLCEGDSCNFETNDDETPVVETCTRSSTQGRKQKYKIRGKRFKKSKGGCKVRIGKVEATKVTVINENEIECEFEDGVGFPQDVTPEVEFETGDKCVIEPQAKVTVPVENPNPVAGQYSSVRGGADLEYKGTGLGTDKNLEVEICGFKCPRSTEKETDDKVVCSLPPIFSAHTVQKHPNSVKSGNLYNLPSTSLYSSNTTLAKKAFDGSTISSFGNTELCYVGLKISPFQRMSLEEIKYYLHPNSPKQHYVGGTFKASLDGVKWTTIAEIKELPMDGWNTIDNNCSPFSFNMYRYIKYQPAPNHLKACDFSELQFRGKEMFVEQREEFPCNAVLYSVDGTKRTQVHKKEAAVTYSYKQTPKITGLNKRYISWRGGDELTISGEGFGSTPSHVNVTIDGIECKVTASVDNSITCLTGKRAQLVSPSTLNVLIKGKGYAENQGHIAKYVCYFSDQDCWGQDYAPGPGDTLHIPAGFNLVIDVDEVPNMENAELEDLPYLEAVVVEGSLIFETKEGNDDHKRTFSAGYIIAREGTIEIGTALNPYKSNLEIILYGNKEDPQLPLFGNKVIGVWEGKLDIHGKKRPHTWLELAQTAKKGATEIVIHKKASETDWKKGDEIVIASTSFEYTEAEKFTIKEVKQTSDDNAYLVVQIEGTLAHNHYAGSKDYGEPGTPALLTMRAEVGLLTRSVKIRGDDSTPNSKYGGHIMLKGDNVVGRISHVELKNMGQAYQLQRHPVTFTESEHLGSSYVSHSSIWDGYNRAVAIHASNCLRIEGNIAYNVMGHNYFLQDGIEIKNSFIRNLAISTVPSHSLLNTDQTPASFWITNPNNYLEGNHAAGSDMYGFWFDLPDNPTGSSATKDICPTGVKLGSFNENVAHTNGRYGLRIFPKHIPRTYPCVAAWIEPPQKSENPEDVAFAKNPPIPAEYKNFLGFKNKRSAIITEEIGAVQFKKITTADNMEEGIEISLPGHAKIDQGFLDGALIVGFSENFGDPTLYKETKGITTGQRDSFTYKNIKFADLSMEGNDKVAAIGTCSHCSLSLDEDGFVNTHQIESVTFKNVTAKILYHALKRTVIYNPDGSIVGKQGSFYLASYLPHLQDNAGSCALESSLDNSIVCSKPIRKLIFRNVEPNTEFSGQEIKIIKKGDMPSAGQAWTEQMLAKYTKLLPNLKLAGQWEVPFLMGQDYHIHWLEYLDWTSVTMKRSRLYKVEDGYFNLVFNHTDRRDIFKVKGRAQISNQTEAGSTKLTQKFGQHHHYLAKKEWEVLVNANQYDAGLSVDSSITVSTVRCADGCAPDEGLGALEQRIRYWSVASDWDVPSEGIVGHVPVAGESPHIRRGWNMYYDIISDPTLPQLASVLIQGRLTFNDTLIDGKPRTYELKSHIIAIELGELLIGTASKPYENNAIITLLGNTDSPVYSYSNSVSAGNKIIFVTGNFVAYGKDPLGGGKYQTKLQKSCKKDDSIIYVEPGLKWKPNQKIAIAPSGYNEMLHQEFTIVEYNDSTGETKINKPIQNSHYGDSYEEKDGSFTYDMRAEVAMLSRNIKIRGEENNIWGGQVFVTEWTNPVTQTTFSGRLVFKYVELERMSQHDTMHAAIRLRSLRTKIASISYSSIHHSRGLALFVLDAHSVTFNHNVIYKTLRNSVVVRIANDFEMMHNLIISNEARRWNPEVQLRDFQVAVDVCTGELVTTCRNIKIQENIVAGGKGVAFAAPSADCSSVETETATQNSFKNNKAHSVYAGLISHVNKAITAPYCGLVQHFFVHHASQVGVQSLYYFTHIVARDLIIVDAKVGIQLGLANGDNPNGNITLSNSLISGEHTGTLDCGHTSEGTGSVKIAMMTSPGFATTLEPPYSYPTNSFHKFGIAATRGKSMLVEKVTFKNYNKRTCNLGNIPRVIQLHEDSSDLIMKHVFKDITIDNVNEANLLYLADPDPKWADLKYCGEFVCTGPENVLFEFQGSIAQKNNQILILPATPFTVISNNEGVADSSCSLVTNWNANRCNSTNWGLLQFESLDPDNFDRALQPIYITSEDNKSFKNKLNAFMDRATGGFYIDQKRMSRFGSLIRTNQDGFFNVSYTGTPPLRQIFELHGASKSDYLKVRIDFTSPESVRVLKNGAKLAQNEIVNGTMVPLVGDVCGENRWDPVNAILEFTIQGGDGECHLELKTQDSIQLGLRMDMNINEFYSTNGQVSFIDKIAMQLGIERDRIKIVAIREGSVVINFEIEPNQSLDGTQSQEIELQIISTEIQNQVNNGTLDVGAPLLDFEINLKLHPTQTSETSTHNPHTVQAKKQSLVWPIAIMVLSVSLIFATVVLLIIFIKRRAKKVSIGEVVNKDDPIFRKVAPSRMESIADSIASNVTSDRNLKAFPGQSLDFTSQLNKKL